MYSSLIVFIYSKRLHNEKPTYYYFSIDDFTYFLPIYNNDRLRNQETETENKKTN